MQSQGNYYYNNQTYNQNYVNRGPNPARFATYQVVPDQSGFIIPGCNFVFKFDNEGGWYDEFGNYYNADGNPAHPPPIYDEDDYDYDANQLANEYEMDDDDYEDNALKHYDNIYLNIENKKILSKLLKDQDVSVVIRSVNFQCTEDDFEKFLVERKIDWIEFEFEYDTKNRFNGTCYMTLDKPNAEKLIEFNGKKFLGRDLRINLQKPEKENSEDEEDEDVHNLGLGDLQEALKNIPQEEEEKAQEATESKSNVKPTSDAQKTDKPEEQKAPEQPEAKETTTGAWGNTLKKPKVAKQ